MKKMHFIVTILVGAATFAAGFVLRPLIWPGEERQETTAEPKQDTAVEVRQQEVSAQELAAQGYLPMETLKVRIDDGEVQWYDGTVWHTVATVEEMGREDKFYVAQENFKEFEEQMEQQMEVRRAEQESIGGQEETLLVGQKAEPKPTEKPKPTKPTVKAPVPESTTSPEDNGGSQGGSGGTTEGGNTSGGNSGSAGGGNPEGGSSGSGNSGSTEGGNPGGDNPGGGDSGSTGGDNSGGGDSGSTGGDNSGGGDSGSTGGDNTGGGDTGDGENMEWSDDYL